MTQDFRQDATGSAVGFMLMGVFGGLCLDLCAKALLADYSLEQFVFLRSLIGVCIFLVISRGYGGLGALVTVRWQWHLLRALLSTCTMFGFFYGLSQMPLVEALTLGFTAPLMVTALSVPFLGDHVGWRRWTAVLVGFGGVLIMLRPGSTEITLASMAVLFAAFTYACMAITSRKLAATESAFALSIYAVAGPMVASAAMIDESTWQSPDTTGWILFVLAGICSVITWTGIVGAYRRAAPAILAPFEYTALIGGAVAGYLIWNEVPDRYVVIGATIIIASGLFVVYREIGSAISRRWISLRPRR